MNNIYANGFMKTDLVVIYDGIQNSVFHGQVLVPLIKRLEGSSGNRALLISFERNPRTALAAAYKIIPTKYPIRLIVLHALPFIGTLSLRYAIYQLKRELKKHIRPTTIRARGPLAGWIVGHTDLLADIPCIVQARGLATEEYRYMHQQSSAFTWYHYVRAKLYENVERWVYHSYAQQNHVSIHAVSNALKHYVIDYFKSPFEKMSVECNDTPSVIQHNQQQAWRKSVRTDLAIVPDTFVYVYNGSAKSWQCPHETINFFKHAHNKNPQSFLLVLTQDIAVFTTLLADTDIPKNSYQIITVPHDQIYRYLSAADAGIIFREKHVINWVSRPTKVLEYQAVGIKIVHNHTIELLAQDS